MECNASYACPAAAFVIERGRPSFHAVGYQRKEAIKRRAAGETLAEIAKSYAVDISMISRLS
jgi:hypothetical protein